MRFHGFVTEIFGDPAQLACLGLLLRQETGLSGRELARQAGISQFKVRAVLTTLQQQGLLIVATAGRAHLYRLNRKHFLFEKIKPLLELEETFFSFLATWMIDHLHFKPLAILLYGSMARGDERPDSDVDLLFVVKAKLEKGTDKIHKDLANMPHVFGNHPAPIVITPAILRKAIRERNPLFLQIMKEGIVLFGKTIQELIL